jgi:N-methylhydantoinase B
MPLSASLLRTGESFSHVSAGGGGFGDPFEREPARVLEDVRDGKVSVAAARERYGVAIDDGEVDVDATGALRKGR